MAWSTPIHVVFPDKPTAVAFGLTLGIAFPEDGDIPQGNANFALQPVQPPWATAPTQDGDGNVLTPGALEPGYWLMGRVNLEWPGAEAALAAIEDAGVRRTRDDWTWA